eukprot:Sdes_comp17857_c0_seq2m7128
MLDIVLFRDLLGGNSALVRQSQILRGFSGEMVDKVQSLDASLKELKFQYDEMNFKINENQKKITNHLKHFNGLVGKIHLKEQENSPKTLLAKDEFFDDFIKKKFQHR